MSIDEMSKVFLDGIRNYLEQGELDKADSETRKLFYEVQKKIISDL